MRWFAALPVVVVLCVMCTDKTVKPESRLPEYLGSLKLKSVVSGVKADKFMYRMHGKPIGSGSSVIGYYGSTDTATILYVTRFDSTDHAETALGKMVSRMAASSGPFTPVHKEDSGNSVVFTTSGMGCAHYFYREKSSVIWLQAEPDSAADLYRHVSNLIIH